MEMKKLDKRRIFILDILRIICAALVFMSHTIGMYGCTYGQKADLFIMSIRGAVMTCFFMLSGFSIRLSTENITFETWRELKGFYLKRGLAILPVYYVFHIIWCCFFEDNIRLSLILTPIELLGLQSAFNSLFGILHNGGTWFISCILFAYFMYPLIHKILIHISTKAKIILIILGAFGLQYANFVVAELGLDSFYSNPIFRTGEFLIGAVLCDLLIKMSGREIRNFVLGDCILIAGILVKELLAGGGIYSRIIRMELAVIGGCILIFVAAYLIRYKRFENSRVLKYCSRITFEIYLTQMYAWKISDYLLVEAGTNLQKIVVSFIVTVVLAMILDRICVIIRKYLENKIVKSYMY